MSKFDNAYENHFSNSEKRFNLPPPLPKVPDLHPEKPPPNVPIPGEPTVGGETRHFKCKKCGRVFNSKEELQVHMTTDHGPKKA